VSIDVHFFFVEVFACQKRKTCKNFVKHIHCSHELGHDEGDSVQTSPSPEKPEFWRVV
jgi:hypothetical protein